MKPLARALLDMASMCPTWYQGRDGRPLATLDECSTVFQWAARPDETTPETTKIIIKVVEALFDEGKLPLTDVSVLQAINHLKNGVPDA